MSYDKVECYVRTADGDSRDPTCYIFPETSRPLKLDGLNIGVALDLKPGTPTKDTDDLAELMRKHVTHVRVWTVD
jgi:hypothetical protein